MPATVSKAMDSFRPKTINPRMPMIVIKIVRYTAFFLFPSFCGLYIVPIGITKYKKEECSVYKYVSNSI